MPLFKSKSSKSSPASTPQTRSTTNSQPSSPSLQPQSSQRSLDPPSYDNSESGLNSINSSLSSLNIRPPPIQRQSSSSLLRTNNRPVKEKTKNVPYRPAPEQQAFIDNLGSEGVTSLSATTSAAHTEYFDVLPSFHMFQSILKRDDEQFGENLTVSPPEYGDTANSSPTPPDLSPVSSRMESATTIDAVLSNDDQNNDQPNEYNEDEDYAFDDDEANEGLQHHQRGNISNAHATYGHTVLDNIDKLPKLNTSPIDIQIFVTKQVPEPHQANDLETRLKEYSNGDLVNGYIIITNNSSKPVNFGLFTVSLEGTIKAVERKVDSIQYSKLLMKKFLKMYDLNASYNYSYVPNSAGIEYNAFDVDQYDDCIIGLPNERVLQPNTKYKKFFTFKFPKKLLDTTCTSNVLAHIIPPPSMGVDKLAFGGKANNIELNKALGYGFVSTKGTPLLVRDHSFDDMDISYTIEAKFIDKLNNNEAVSHSEINSSSNEKDYVVSRHAQYFLRFVPDLKELLDLYNQEFLYGKETYGSIGIDGKLFDNYLYLNTWRNYNRMNSIIEEEIDARLIKQEFDDDQIKQKNLIVNNYITTNLVNENLMTKEPRPLPTLQMTEYTDDYFKQQRMIGSKYVDIYGKKKKKLLTSYHKIGKLKIYAQVPSQPLTYNSPKLIMKYNRTEEEPETNDLVPVNSISSDHINQLYHRSADDYSHSVKVDIIFESLEQGVAAPSIQSIDVNVVAWSFRADYPLPCIFEYDFFYSSAYGQDAEISETLQQIKDQINGYIQFLKSNKTHISKNSYLYLKAMKTLGIKRDTLKEYLKSYNAVTSPELLKDDWKGTQTKDNTIRWVKQIDIPLEIINKHNITLTPSFQSCLMGRLYCLQVVVKFKGGSKEDENILKIDVPVIVG